MASLQGLPPLPKSLSGLLNFSSAQWKEMEKLHAMRTMIQKDLSRGMAERANVQRTQSTIKSNESLPDVDVNFGKDCKEMTRASRLDIQLALLRKEMVGLRQLDMSLLCQLWSLNESIQEYKQLMQERVSLNLSPIHASSPGWDNGIDSPSSEEHGEINSQFDLERSGIRIFGIRSNQDLNLVPEQLPSSDSAHSSLEFGDI